MLERVELYFDIGSGEKLRCSIHNETNYARWVINGVKLEITNSTSQRIRAGDNGDLFIDDVQLSDGGTYECQIMSSWRDKLLYCIQKVNLSPRPTEVDLSTLPV